MRNNLTKYQAETLACIVNYSLDHGGVPSNEELGRLLVVNSEAARKRKRLLIKMGYLLPVEGKGNYEINRALFCATRLTARFLLYFREVKKDGFINEDSLLERSTDTIFSGRKDHAVSTLEACLKFGYLSRHQNRENQIEEGSLDGHYGYLLLISNLDGMKNEIF